MKKERTAKRNFMLTLIMTALFFVSAFVMMSCANSNQSFEIELSDRVYWDRLFINEEYDILQLVEPASGAEYYLDEVFYLDANFEKKAIPYSGSKFTQDKPFDVILTIGAKKDKLTADPVDIELKIYYKTTPVLSDMMQSWCDVGVTKTLHAEPEYLTAGNSTGIKISYLGDYNPIGEGVNIGGFSKSNKSYSVKNWENAVVTMDVFNPNAYNISFAFYYSPDGDNWTLLWDDPAYTLEAGKWTTTAYSLKRLGFSSNFIANNQGTFSFKMRLPDSAQQVAPFNYNIYVCGLDVTDYSSESFPDLITKSNEEMNKELYDAATGETIDKIMTFYAHHDSTYKAEINNDPLNIKDGASSIKYTFTKNSEKGNPTENRATLMLDNTNRLLNEVLAVDWNTAYAGFWLKNTTGFVVDISLRFASSQDGITFSGATYFNFDSYNTTIYADANNTNWIYCEYSLKTLFPAMLTTNVTAIKLSLSTEIVSNEGVPVSFYIDSFDIYNGSRKP